MNFFEFFERSGFLWILMAVYMAFSMESRMNTLVPFIMGVILMTFQFFRLCDQPALGSEVYRIPVTMSLASMLVLFLVGIIVATAERLGNTMHFRETGEVLTSYWDQSLPWVNALLFVVPFTYVYSSLLLSRSSRRQ